MSANCVTKVYRMKCQYVGRLRQQGTNTNVMDFARQEQIYDYIKKYELNGIHNEVGKDWTRLI